MKLLLTTLLLTTSLYAATPMPQIVHQNDKYSLMVDGKPFIVLGAQTLNSSAWPEQFDALLPGAAALA